MIAVYILSSAEVATMGSTYYVRMSSEYKSHNFMRLASGIRKWEPRKASEGEVEDQDQIALAKYHDWITSVEIFIN